MLILTEKPSVAKDFANALGASFSGGAYKSETATITNCVGHLFELEEPGHYGTEFPIIPGKFDYRVNPNVEKQAKFVVSLLKSHKSDSILIATDADREGEIIARECLSQVGITDFSRIKRFWVSEALTPEVVRNGIKAAKPLSEYDRIAEQGFARQRADWLTGMNFCRYITQAAARKLVVGRVQTAVLSAIEQRCAAIKNFKSEKYFEHYGVFRPTRVGSFKNLNQPTADGRKLVGLGTPATRHTFIPKLLKNGYIEIDKKNIAVTELGETLLKAVRSSAIKSLADISATADWEERLDENPAKFLDDIKSFVKDSVTQSVKIEVPLPAASGIVCPVCGKEVRRGKSNWYCSGYKEGCKFSIWESVASAKVTEKDVAALCGGKTTGIKHCVSKAGKAFDCRFVLDSEKKIKFVFEEKRK